MLLFSEKQIFDVERKKKVSRNKNRSGRERRNIVWDSEMMKFDIGGQTTPFNLLKLISNDPDCAEFIAQVGRRGNSGSVRSACCSLESKIVLLIGALILFPITPKRRNILP